MSIIKYKGQPLSNLAINGSCWMLMDSCSANRLKKMEAVSVPLVNYINTKIYVGIKTGFNRAFWISNITKDNLINSNPKNQELIKRLIVGKDINKWKTNYQDRWLIRADS